MYGLIRDYSILAPGNLFLEFFYIHCCIQTKTKESRKSRRSLILQSRAKNPLPQQIRGTINFNLGPLTEFWRQISKFGRLANPYFSLGGV